MDDKLKKIGIQIPNILLLKNKIINLKNSKIN